MDLNKILNGIDNHAVLPGIFRPEGQHVRGMIKSVPAVNADRFMEPEEICRILSAMGGHLLDLVHIDAETNAGERK
jgi:hypothetical protein